MNAYLGMLQNISLFGLVQAAWVGGQIAYHGGAPDTHQHGYQQGYQDGVNAGLSDGTQNHPYQPRQRLAWKNGIHGYDAALGSQSAYRTAYRTAYERGYQDGFRSTQ